VVNAAPPASLAAPSELSIPDAALDDLPQDDATAQEAVGETAAGLDTTTATMAGPEPN
jgi:hypothetical protein